MKIRPFLTEHFFTKYEFTSPHMLASSDCETMSIAELLEMSGSSLEKLGAQDLGYTEPQGNEALRYLIADSYVSATAADVVVLTAPVEGIYLTMRVLLDREDEVIALRPAYDALNNVAEHICQKLVPWHLSPGDACWDLDFDSLESLVNERTKLIVINFPHNPTGYMPTVGEFKRLIRFAEDHDCWIFCDEIYRGIEFGDPIPSAADLSRRAIVLGGLSKAHGLPGLRSGWLVIRDQSLRDELINWKHYTTICPSAPSEFLAIEALKIRRQLTKRNKQIVKQNMTICEAFCARHKNLFTWRPPQAGTVAFIEIDLERIGFASATEYCHHLAQNHGVVLLPGACLGFNDRFVRVGLGRKGFGNALVAYERTLTESAIR